MGSDFDGIHSGIAYDVKETWLNFSSSRYFNKECAFYPSKEYLSSTRNRKTFISEIVILHRIPKNVILDRGLVFIGRFWTNFQESLGMKLNFSMEYHIETYGHIYRLNQVLEDMLHMYVID